LNRYQKHLTEDAIESLLEAREHDSDVGVPPILLGTGMEDFAQCAECKKLFQTALALSKSLSNLDQAHGSLSTAHCPTREELWSWSLGTVDPSKSDLLTEHISECDVCAMQVRHDAKVLI
jgi:hypothetical protein